MGRASKIYKDNSSPEEVEEILKGQTLNLENYNAGVIVCNWKDNEKGFDFALFGQGQELAALLTELELKLPKEIRVSRNMMLRKARMDLVKQKSLGAKAPLNSKIYH